MPARALLIQVPARRLATNIPQEARSTTCMGLRETKCSTSLDPALFDHLEKRAAYSTLPYRSICGDSGEVENDECVTPDGVWLALEPKAITCELDELRLNRSRSGAIGKRLTLEQ